MTYNDIRVKTIFKRCYGHLFTIELFWTTFSCILLLLIRILARASPGATAPPPPLPATDSTARKLPCWPPLAGLSCPLIQPGSLATGWLDTGVGTTLTSLLLACPACGFFPPDCRSPRQCRRTPPQSGGPGCPLSRGRDPRPCSY